MHDSFVTSPRTAEDVPEIAALLDICFGPDRKTRTAELLRRGTRLVPGTSFVTRDGAARHPTCGTLIGTVECHLLSARHDSGPARPIVILGPLAVAPWHPNEGIGRALMARALAATDAAGLDVMLIGDAPYYARWNFSAKGTADWLLPGPVDRARLLLRSATPARWAGKLTFGPPDTKEI